MYSAKIEKIAVENLPNKKEEKEDVEAVKIKLK